MTDLPNAEQNDNIRLVKELFTAINGNDLQSAVNRMTDDIDWQSPVTNTITQPVSWAKRRRNRMEVVAFFEEVRRKTAGFELKPESFLSAADRVVIEGATQGVVASTGRDFLSRWVMIVTVRDGRVSKLRQYYDTADVAKAFRAAAEARKAA